MGQMVGYNHNKRITNRLELAAVIDKVYPILKKMELEFDALVCIGHSTAVPSAILAHKLGKNLVIIRKENERSNPYGEFQGETEQRCIMVDDLHCTGSTLSRVKKVLDAYSCTLVGLCLHMADFSNTKSEIDGVKNLTFKG